MKSKSITSVTFILVGNMLIIYNSIGEGWTATLTAIFGLILFFVGLSRLKTSLDDTGKNGVSKLIWAAILVIIATLFSYIPLVGGIPAGILNLLAFILWIVGLLKLKNSITIGTKGANGINYLLIAIVLMIISGIFNFIPLIGTYIKSAISLVAFFIIPFGWIKIQEAIIESPLNTIKPVILENNDNSNNTEHTAVIENSLTESERAPIFIQNKNTGERRYVSKHQWDQMIKDGEDVSYTIIG